MKPDRFDKKLAAQRRDTKPDPFVCAICGTRFVVALLARLCEEKPHD